MLCAALLAEAERLGQECVEVQRQAEKDCCGLASRLQMLEQALEEQEGRAHQLEEQHRLQTEDLQQHINALEKQLKHNRQFIDVSVSSSLFNCLKFIAGKSECELGEINDSAFFPLMYRNKQWSGSMREMNSSRK